MKIAVTGGTGFVGRHLARALVEAGHEVVLIARGLDSRDPEIRALHDATFAPVGTSSVAKLVEAFAGCDAVAHCAGINRAIGEQTYERVHVQGTQNVVDAARRTGVKKVLLLSFLRARPNCGSEYHESKWAAEEIVRGSGLDYTIIKAGMIYGKGDHMLDHLSHTLHSLPVFATVGFEEKPIRPVAVEDVVQILQASLAEGRLSRETVAVLGPQSMRLSDAVRQTARIIGKRVFVFPQPVFVHRLLAWFFEHTMAVPLISSAQVFMLSESMTEALPEGVASELPGDLSPRTRFEDLQIRARLPEPKPFGLADFRCHLVWRGGSLVPAPDEIHVANLALNVRVGVSDEEQADPQRLSVSLTLRPARGFDGLDDRIENTVNYAAVCAAVRALAATHPRRLIETLALDIAGEILSRFAVASVDVELRKYILSDADYVAVRLSRQRPSDSPASL